MKKTNVMRLLESKKVNYESFQYEIGDGKIDGISVAKKIQQPINKVYKTLVCQGKARENFVFVIPVGEELNLKLGAKAVGEKSISMVKVSEINGLTGYERGGCSPIGMKKEYKTIISKEAEDMESIIVSAGMIGSQVKLSPKDIGKFVEVEFKNII